MKNKIFTICFLLITTFSFAQNIGLGTTTPDSSAILDITSANKGLLIPRTDTSLITNPATGLMIFSNTDKTFYYYDGGVWQTVGGSVWKKIGQSDSIIYKKTQANVTIENGGGNRTNMDGNAITFLDSVGNFGFNNSHYSAFGRDSLKIVFQNPFSFSEAKMLPGLLSMSAAYNFSSFQMDLSNSILKFKQMGQSNSLVDRFLLENGNILGSNDTGKSMYYIGQNAFGVSGDISLFDGINDYKLAHLGTIGNNSFLELNHKNDKRVGLWSLDNYGLITTQGSNGSQNTYIGQALNHNNPNFGGIGVMDSFGLIKAGMEVDANGMGNIYSEGQFQIINDANQDLVSIGKYPAVLGGAGFVTTNKSNGATNFSAGANLTFDGNANVGIATVSNELGTSIAGMAVTSDNQGQLFADAVNIGKTPNAGNLYPFHLVEPSNFGLNIEKGSNRWELYVSNLGTLELYLNNSVKGSFDPVSGAYTASSDRRLKTNISRMSKTLSSLVALNPSKYSFKTDNPTNRNSYGFIAQEVKEVFPELVRTNSNEKSGGMMSIDYTGLTVVAIKAIQEQQQIIEAQQKELERYKAEINDHKSRLEKLEQILLKN